MNLDIGTDIVSIERMTKVLKRHRFAFLQRFLLPNEIFMVYRKKDSLSLGCDFHHFISDNLTNNALTIWTNEELNCYQAKTAKVLESLKNNFHVVDYRLTSIASLWALKESLAKALGVGIGSLLSFHDICIYKDCLGKPHIALRKECKEILESRTGIALEKISVSVSHDGGFAIGTCVVLFKIADK